MSGIRHDRRCLVEEWRAVISYEGYYEVSSEGQVRRVGSRKTLKPNMVLGYPLVTLCVNGRQRKVGVHRLVIEAFVGPISEALEVHHKDFNRANPKLSNLEVVTVRDNHLRSAAEGRLIHKLTEQQVREIRLRRAEGDGIRSMGREYGVSHHAILDIVAKRTWAWLQ